MVRHGTCQHNYAVERGLVVGFCGHPPYSNQPYLVLSNSQVLISLVTRGLCSTISGQAKAHVVQICTNGVLPNDFLVIMASDRP